MSPNVNASAGFMSHLCGMSNSAEQTRSRDHAVAELSALNPRLFKLILNASADAKRSVLPGHNKVQLNLARVPSSALEQLSPRTVDRIDKALRFSVRTLEFHDNDHCRSLKPNLAHAAELFPNVRNLIVWGRAGREFDFTHFAKLKSVGFRAVVNMDHVVQTHERRASKNYARPLRASVLNGEDFAARERRTAEQAPRP